MSISERKEQLWQFLLKFEQSPIVLSQESMPLEPMKQLIITYFGMCFVQGYRIIEKVQENMFLMSLMQYQSQNLLNNSQNIKYEQYRIVCIQYDEQINNNKKFREENFQKIKDFMQFFCDGKGIRIHFLFALHFMYSIFDKQQLQTCQPLRVKKFYRGNAIQTQVQREIRNSQENVFSIKKFSADIQGEKLHEIVEMYIKGATTFQNRKYLNQKVLQHSEFKYNLDKVINTLCLIIGKQMIEGGYLTISSQKWVRKFSEKKFKKFDLLLRNQHKVCIIDWKFSTIIADQRILKQKLARKNLQYFQLARKQYNAEVQLKFYCFHTKQTEYYHHYTTATYKYSIQNIDIEENNQIEVGSDSDSVELLQINIQKRERGNEKGYNLWEAVKKEKERSYQNIKMKSQDLHQFLNLATYAEGQQGSKEEQNEVQQEFKMQMYTIYQQQKYIQLVIDDQKITMIPSINKKMPNTKNVGKQPKKIRKNKRVMKITSNFIEID